MSYEPQINGADRQALRHSPDQILAEARRLQAETYARWMKALFTGLTAPFSRSGDRTVRPAQPAHQG